VPFFGLPDYLGVESDQEFIQGIDVFPGSGAKAEMVQARTILLESILPVLLWNPVHHDSRATADSLNDLDVSIDQLHFQKRKQPSIELFAFIKLAHIDCQVCDAVHLHGSVSLMTEVDRVRAKYSVFLLWPQNTDPKLLSENRNDHRPIA